MACLATVAGRALPCRDSLGGIKQIWVAPFVEGMWDTITVNGFIDAATVATTVKNYNMNKNTGSLTTTVNSSIENGTMWYSQVVSCVFPKYDSKDSENIRQLCKGKLAIIVQDVNNNYFCCGHTRGCELTAGTQVTGVAMGDANGYTLEFTAQEFIAPPFFDRVSAAAATPATTFTETA